METLKIAERKRGNMGKRSVVLGLCILILDLSILYFTQAKSSSRVIQVKITRDGHFVPERILIKQDQGVIFRVTASCHPRSIYNYKLNKNALCGALAFAYQR